EDDQTVNKVVNVRFSGRYLNDIPLLFDILPLNHVITMIPFHETKCRDVGTLRWFSPGDFTRESVNARAECFNSTLLRENKLLQVINWTSRFGSHWKKNYNNERGKGRESVNTK
ncbi:hypothetical protein CEXT_58751, partial [Caerostris extrusa]